MWLIAVATVGRHSQGAFWDEIFVTDIKGKTWIIKGRQEANINWLTRQSPWQGLTKTPTIFKRIVV
jgi:hypothetical protein